MPNKNNKLKQGGAMRIEMINLDDYTDHPDNPRVEYKEGDPPFEAVSKSIDEYDFLQPLIVNIRTKRIIAGHLRKRVLKAKGIGMAEAVIVDFDEVKERAAVIAFNKISGSWNFVKLASVLDGLSKIPSFDVGLTGFETPEISQLLDRYTEPKDADSFDFQAAVDSIQEPITKRGDLIELGQHRLLCGDSAEPNDLKLLMNDQKANMLFTDPPYGISYYQGNRPNMNFRPKKCRKWEIIYKDDLPEEEYQKWFEGVLTNMDNFLSPGAPIYIFNAHKQFFGMYGILRKLKYHIGTVIVWAKPNFSISYGDYNPQVEFCAYAWKEDNGAHKWYGPANETTLWEIKRDVTKDYQHLTQKPVEIPARAIRNSSVRGDVVLELFGGSGSTLIAAESLGRRCFCVEICPAFCDSIVKRYAVYVGADELSQEVREKYLQEAPYGQQ